MSGPEVAYRLGRVARQGWRSIAAPLQSRAGAEAPASFEFGRAEQTQLLAPPVEPDAATDERLLAGELPVYGRWIRWRDDPAFWHTDHLTGATWPMERTARIPYRAGNPIGDVRIVWEPNRLQHLFSLARIAAADAQRRDRAVELMDAQLRSWLAANPPGVGVNHASAMEQALRIVAVCHALDLARPWLPRSFADRVGALVVGHAQDIVEGVSVYSSAGNHTIAEATGLLYAGLLFREHRMASGWDRTARKLLRIEAARQVLPDGGGLEQAPWYLLFVTDLLGLAQALLQARRDPAIPEVDGAVIRAREFLGTIATSPRDLPPIGDGDDGHALSPHLRLSWGRARPAAEARHFAQSGVTVVRGAGERLVFLHGPLGMPPSFAHGHADGLSVLLRRGDVDLLLDPGTYQYGGPAELRAWFRSTAAHNTVQVGGRDQAQQIARFMWKAPYACEVALARLDGDDKLVLASHDGYRALGVTHWRGVAYRPGRFLAVWDRLDGAERHEAFVHWHFGCPVRLDAERHEAILDVPGADAVRMTLPPGEVARFEACRDPILGWRSPVYGSLEPCTALRQRVEGSRERVTTLWLGAGEREDEHVSRLLSELRKAAAPHR